MGAIEEYSRRFAIEKFDDNNFAYWKMQIKDYLYQALKRKEKKLEKCQMLTRRCLIEES